ncbi:MAG: ABC transporter ATP-binding protein [Zetaproteobacteria bacterium]|nr:MAG: ABC transporter ATP-binding protein [Zetaproteobacteria bacterium]
MLKVRNLSKSFVSPSGGRLVVLKDVGFTLAAGEFLAIVGESGSGKSTMLQTIGTLEPADGGSVELDGESLFELSPTRQAWVRNRKIGFVYQAHHLIPELDALENVMLPLLVRGDDRQLARRRAEELLGRLHLGHRTGHVPARLSGGEAQRVAVARALAVKPCLVLADEPTGNLDESTAEEVFALFREACGKEGAAVVMVTHSTRLAHRCDRMLRLQHGKLTEVFDKP